MANENLIHVKLEFDEAIKSKRDILSSEMGLLKIIKAIKNRQALREEEFKVKINLAKKIRDLKADITKLQVILPKIKIPDILQEKSEDENTGRIAQIKKKTHSDDLESQLEEIQSRLRQLE